MRDPAQFRHPEQRGTILVPGIPTLAPGVRRYLVPGGGSRAVDVCAGDEFTIMDEQGLQQAEIVFFDGEGNSDTGMFGGANAISTENILRTLQSERSGRDILTKLLANGLKLHEASAVAVLGESRPGDTVTFTAEKSGLLIVGAPGMPMLPQEQNAPTPVVLYVKNARYSESELLVARRLQDSLIVPAWPDRTAR